MRNKEQRKMDASKSVKKTSKLGYIIQMLVFIIIVYHRSNVFYGGVEKMWRTRRISHTKVKTGIHDALESPFASLPFLLLFLAAFWNARMALDCEL